MHIDTGILTLALWLFLWAAWSWLEDREHNKVQLTVLGWMHRERMLAMAKRHECLDPTVYDAALKD